MGFLARWIRPGLALCLVGTSASFAIPGMARADPCADLLPPAGPFAPRRLEARDIVQLRDIGYPESSLYAYDDALSIAPDGRSVAFVMRRADPDANQYCSGLVVLDLATGKPAVLDVSTELVTSAPVAIRGLLTPQGLAATNPPRWSPDGRRLIWLKRVAGVTQAWIVARDGSPPVRATAPDQDLDFATWAGDGRSVVVRVSVPMPDEAGGRRGYAYDDRFVPGQGTEPRAIAPGARPLLVVDPQTGLTFAAPETALSDPAYRATGVGSSDTGATSAAGTRAWIAAEGESLFSPKRLWLAPQGGDAGRCDASSCKGEIYNLQWNASGTRLFFIARGGKNGETTMLYRWSGAAGVAPRRMFETRDVLAGCRAAAEDLICLRDSASSPRRLVRINGDTGRSGLLFDPNPGFRSLQPGTAKRLHWRNQFGLETWGDLVLPASYRAGEKLPLIVVQYHSDGFLRGGTGDEYPVHLFASRGFAVLSVERVQPYASLVDNVRDYKEANRVNGVGWRERRSLLSSIETGVALAIATGTVDPKRVGLTGLSDGATTTQFALINSRIFAAAAMSSCCIDANTVMIYGGPRWAQELQRRGYPPLTRPDPQFWAPMSLSANAARVDIPLLLQLPSEEYLLALESFTALRELGKPVDMYVFAGEHHVKLQPAHRLAVYERNLAWFEFWFLGQDRIEHATDAELERWVTLKTRARGKEALPASER